jgi:hypothetical protein
MEALVEDEQFVNFSYTLAHTAQIMTMNLLIRFIFVSLVFRLMEALVEDIHFAHTLVFFPLFYLYSTFRQSLSKMSRKITNISV